MLHQTSFFPVRQCQHLEGVGSILVNCVISVVPPARSCVICSSIITIIAMIARLFLCCRCIAHCYGCVYCSLLWVCIMLVYIDHCYIVCICYEHALCCEYIDHLCCVYIDHCNGHAQQASFRAEQFCRCAPNELREGHSATDVKKSCINNKDAPTVGILLELL